MSEFRKVINSNLTTLSDLTKVTNRFLDRCCEQNIITRCDKETLVAKPEGYERNQLFYDLLYKSDSECFQKLVEIMEEEDTRQSTDVLRILNNQPNSSYSIPGSSIQLESNRLKRKHNPNIWFEVEEPVNSFIGRETDLENLHGYVIRNSEKDVSIVTVISQLTSVSGLGGIGKTTLAREYARRYAKYFDYNVIWINAETTSSMEESFARLADEIGIQTKNEKSQITRDRIYKYLEKRKCLLIFDNVESYGGEHGVRHYRPRHPGPNAIRPYILLTSRNSNIIQGCEVLQLGVLREDESVSFLKEQLKIENEGTFNKELMQKLVQKLQCLPLALQQVVAYIGNRQKELQFSCETIDPIEEYLRLLEEHSTSIDLLNYASETGDDYEFTVLTTWNITIDKIRSKGTVGDLAFKLMSMIAYFEPDDIKCSCFSYNTLMDQSAKAAKLLKEYSMIETYSKGVISVHRLVQHVIRIQNKNEECKHLRDCLREIVSQDIPKSGKLRQHIDSIWKYSLLHPALVSEFYRVGLDLSDECSHKQMYERYHTYKNMECHGLELLAKHMQMYYNKSGKADRTKIFEELVKQVPIVVSGWKISLQNGTLAEWNIFRMECFAFSIEAIEGNSRELHKSASEIHQINFECYKLEKYPLERGKEYKLGILNELSKLESHDKYVATLNEVLSLTFKSAEHKVQHEATLKIVISKIVAGLKCVEISLSPSLRPLLAEQNTLLIQRIAIFKDESHYNYEEHMLLLIILIHRLIVLNEGYEDLLKYCKELVKTHDLFVKSYGTWGLVTSKVEKGLDVLFEYLITTALSKRCADRNGSACMETVEICILIWTTRDHSTSNSKKLIEFLHAGMGVKGIGLIRPLGLSVKGTERNNSPLQIQKIDSLAFELIEMGQGYDDESVRNSFMEESLQMCEFVSKFIGHANDCTSETEKLLYLSNRINIVYALLELNQIEDLLKYSDEFYNFLCTRLVPYSLHPRLEKLGTAMLFKVNQAVFKISTPTNDLKNATIKICKCIWEHIINRLTPPFNMETIIKCFVQFGRVDEITNLSTQLQSLSIGSYPVTLPLNIAYNLIKFGKNSEIENFTLEEARNSYTHYVKVDESAYKFSGYTETTKEMISVTMELKVEAGLECLEYICENRDKHDLMPTNSELQELSHSLLQQAINDGDIRLIRKIRDTFCCIYETYFLDNIKKHVSMTAFDSKPLVKCYIELEDLEGMQQFSSELKMSHYAAKENELLHWIVLESFALNLRVQVCRKENFKFSEQFLREADSIFKLVLKHAKL